MIKTTPFEMVFIIRDTVRELEIVRHRQIAGLTIFVNQVDYRTIHIHQEWELIWVLENQLQITCGAEVRQLEPGQMVLFLPNEPHGFQKVGESCTFLCLQLSSRVLPFSEQLQILNRFPHEVLSDAERINLLNSQKSIAIAYFERTELFELECFGQAILILHQLLKSSGFRQLSADECSHLEKRNNRIHRLLQYVDENYTHKIRLRDFAEAEGCSTSYLSHFVKDTLNQTFQEYVASVRFNHACKLISEGKHRMLDICNESGFSDYRYFSQAFRRQVGMTPEEYARKAGSIPANHKNRLQSSHSMERFCSEQESLAILKTISI